MNKQEFPLVLLAEECSEVSQMVSKILRFGIDETQPGGTEDNRKRLESEIIDLLTVIDMLANENTIDLEFSMFGMFSEEITQKMIEKREKIKKYKQYSLSIGTITD